jgi:hypothetical protein
VRREEVNHDGGAVPGRFDNGVRCYDSKPGARRDDDSGMETDEGDEAT